MKEYVSNVGKMKTMDRHKNRVKIKVVKRTQSNTESGYVIYNYFKNKPELLLVLLTAITTILSAGLSILHFLIMRNYYSFWGFVININNQSKLFFLLFIVSLMYLLINHFFTATIREYWDQSYRLIIPKADCESISKKIEELEKEDLDDYNNTQLQEIKKRNQLCIEQYKIWLRELRHELEKASIVYFICSVLVYEVLFAILLGSSNSLIHKISVILPLSYLIIFFIFLLITRIRIKKLAKKMVNMEGFSLESLSLETTFHGKEQMPLQRLKKMDIKGFLSDSSIKGGIMPVFLILFLFVLSFLLLPQFLIKSNKTFDIVDVGNQSYVFFFKDDSYAYLNEAMIDQDSIYISKTVHKILNITEFEYKSQTFENVIPVEDSPVMIEQKSATNEIE